MSEHLYGVPCPSCGHKRAETVDAQVEGRGSMQTFAIRECQSCGVLWGEEREFYGVLPNDA